MSSAGQQRIRIPTFQSPTSQAKTPAATQTRAEERASRIKVQGNNNCASLSVLAEVGPQNLSHLLENRRQSENEPVEQVAKAVSLRSDKATVESGHDDDARNGLVSSNRRTGTSRTTSSTTQISGSRSRTAADIFDSRGDERDTEKIRNNPRSPRKRARVVASDESPRQSVPWLDVKDSRQVDAGQASASPRTVPNSALPRAQARRPRAALAVATMSLPAAEPRPKSVSPEDALDRALAEPSPPTAMETSSRLIVPAADVPSRGPKQSGTSARTREPQQSGDQSTHTIPSSKPKKRTRLRPTPDSPLLSAQNSGTAEADNPPLQHVDSAASRHTEKRPSPTSPRPTPPKRHRNAGSNRRAPPVPDERGPAPPLASTLRASDPGEADVVKIRTDRCLGHASSHPLNAFDIVAGVTKKLAMQARWSAGPEGSAEVFADFAAAVHEKVLRRAMLLSSIAATAERVRAANNRLHES